MKNKNIKTLQKQIQDTITRLQPTIERAQKAAEEYYKRTQPSLIRASKGIKELQERYEPIFIAQLEEAKKNMNHMLETYLLKIEEVTKQAYKWQKEQKTSVAQMAELGWFPNWHTFNYYPNTKYEEIDDFMIAMIDDNWSDMKERILKLSPNRKEILESAFHLHEQENYIASIPLLLSQSDGICSEEFRYFFSKDTIATEEGTTIKMNASDEIIKQVENGELAVDFFTEILLEPFKVDLQLSKSSSKASKQAKMKGPNRHGIIHGSRKHLDYGTKTNGYKALSFLAFIVFTVKDKLKET